MTRPWVLLSNGRTEHFMDSDEAIEYCKKNDLYVIQQYEHYRANYAYTFTNGHEEFLTKQGAQVYCQVNNCKIESGGPLNYSKVSSRNDPYSGFNIALNMDIRGKGHYNQILKERNLIEVGNEFEAHKNIAPPKKNMIDDTMIKELEEAGAELSGNEIAALKKGIDITNN